MLLSLTFQDQDRLILASWAVECMLWGQATKWERVTGGVRTKDSAPVEKVYRTVYRNSGQTDNQSKKRSGARLVEAGWNQEGTGWNPGQGQKDHHKETDEAGESGTDKVGQGRPDGRIPIWQTALTRWAWWAGPLGQRQKNTKLDDWTGTEREKIRRHP